MKGTRQRIEAEAEALLMEFGVQFPFRELERRAKVGSGGLRHHFRSKEELVASSTLRQLQPFKDRFDALVQVGQTVDYVLEYWLFHLAEWIGAVFGRAGIILASASDRFSPLGRTFQDIVSMTAGFVLDARERINPDAHADEVVLMTLASIAAADRFVPTDPAATFNERRSHQAARNLHFYLNGVGQPSSYTPSPNA